MPRKSLQGRTCGVSRDGGRARALQPNRRPAAPLTSSVPSRSLACSSTESWKRTHDGVRLATHARSKRSSCITLVQAATKSWTNLSCASALA
ncbi:hypothetical protein XarbCFBP7604_12400 [Xanthomonas arboricola]|nr:hypothetical protein XarbCFBP7604_12400 [Xanthomonas arboricola]